MDVWSLNLAFLFWSWFQWCSVGSLISELRHPINKISIWGWLGVLGERTKKYEECQSMSFHPQKQQSLKKSALKAVVNSLVRHFEVPKIIFTFRHIFLSVLTGILKWFSRRDFHKNALQLRLTTPKATHSLANLRLVRGFCQFLSVIILQNCCEYDCIQRIQWFVCSGGSWYHRNRFLVTVISGIKRSIVHVIHPSLLYSS